MRKLTQKPKQRVDLYIITGLLTSVQSNITARHEHLVIVLLSCCSVDFMETNLQSFYFLTHWREDGFVLLINQGWSLEAFWRLESCFNDQFRFVTLQQRRDSQSSSCPSRGSTHFFRRGSVSGKNLQHDLISTLRPNNLNKKRFLDLFVWIIF